MFRLRFSLQGGNLAQQLADVVASDRLAHEGAVHRSGGCCPRGGDVRGRAVNRLLFLLISLVLVYVVVMGFKYLDDQNMVGTDRQPQTITVPAR